MGTTDTQRDSAAKAKATVRAPAFASHACKRPNVAVMDYRRHEGSSDHRGFPVVNRMCLTCGTHWFGEAEANVVQIPRATWDAWMSEPEAQVAA